jgi:hypothetical protein
MGDSNTLQQVDNPAIEIQRVSSMKQNMTEEKIITPNHD